MKCYYCHNTMTKDKSYGRYYSFCKSCYEKLYNIGGYGLVYKAIATNKEKDIKKLKKLLTSN